MPSHFLANEQKDAAQLLSSMLLSLESWKKRFQELVSSQDETVRDLVPMSRLPRVHVGDVALNADAMQVLIEFVFTDFPRYDKFVSNPGFVQYVFWLMDSGLEFKVSAQSLISLRDHYHQWEADKLRLVWAYFKRQLERTEFSNNVFVGRLKQRFLLKKAMSDSGCLATSAISLTVASSSGVLDCLPDFPVEDDASPTEGEDDASPTESEDKADTAEVIAVEDDASATGGDTAEVIAGEADTAKVIADADKADTAKVIPGEVVADQNCDEFLPLPASFFDPLPPSLEIGLKRRDRPSCPNIDGLLKALESDTKAVNPKDHKRRVAAALKRPAGALPVPPTGDETTAGALAPTSALKRLAGALTVPPTGDETTASDLMVGDDDLVMGEVSQGHEHKLALMKSIRVCEGPLVSGQEGKVVVSVQHGIFIAQIRDMKSKRMISMVTDKMFGCETKARRAADVLLELFKMGAPPQDLQRAKVLGCLFGVPCGKGAPKDVKDAKKVTKKVTK